VITFVDHVGISYNLSEQFSKFASALQNNNTRYSMNASQSSFFHLSCKCIVHFCKIFVLLVIYVIYLCYFFSSCVHCAFHNLILKIIEKVIAFVDNIMVYYRAALNAGQSSQQKAVCLSLCQTRALQQNGRKFCPDFCTVQKII